MPLLGVNIDHVATLRQARRGRWPEPVRAAVVAEESGADGITVHLREDRRHIQDKDVVSIRKTIKTRLNLEMAATKDMIDFALRVRPDSVCLVPEKRAELTTEGGLNIVARRSRIRSTIKRIQARGIVVSIFIDPDFDQIRMAHALGAKCVELHTGRYTDADSSRLREKEFKKLKDAGALAIELGLTLNAGHGLDYDNVVPVARISGMHELNIGFSIIVRTVFTGLGKAVREMKKLVSI